jgi:hypothetical protein
MPPRLHAEPTNGRRGVTEVDGGRDRLDVEDHRQPTGKTIDRSAIVPYISRMRKTTIYLEDDMYRTLRRLADGSGRTQAQIIRDALLAYTRGERRRPRSIGMGKGGPRLSERADELLSGFGEDG